MSTEAKREVWVREVNGLPVCLDHQMHPPPEPKPLVGAAVVQTVRYVPESAVPAVPVTAATEQDWKARKLDAILLLKALRDIGWEPTGKEPQPEAADRHIALVHEALQTAAAQPSPPAATRSEDIAHGRALLLEIGGNCEESWQQSDKTFEVAAQLAEALARVVGRPEYDEAAGDYRYPSLPAPPKEPPAGQWVSGNGSDLSEGTIAWLHQSVDHHMPYVTEHPMRRSKDGWNLGMFHFADTGVTHYLLVTPPPPPQEQGK